MPAGRRSKCHLQLQNLWSWSPAEACRRYNSVALKEEHCSQSRFAVSYFLLSTRGEEGLISHSFSKIPLSPPIFSAHHLAN